MSKLEPKRAPIQQNPAPNALEVAARVAISSRRTSSSLVVDEWKWQDEAENCSQTRGDDGLQFGRSAEGQEEEQKSSKSTRRRQSDNSSSESARLLRSQEGAFLPRPCQAESSAELEPLTVVREPWQSSYGIKVCKDS